MEGLTEDREKFTDVVRAGLTTYLSIVVTVLAFTMVFHIVPEENRETCSHFIDYLCGVLTMAYAFYFTSTPNKKPVTDNSNITVADKIEVK